MARLVLDCVGSFVPTNEVSEYWAIGRRFRPHSHRLFRIDSLCITVQPPDNRNIYRAIHSLGYLCSVQGEMQEAEAMYRRALEGFEEAWGPEHTSMLATVNNLAICYSDQGKTQEAEALYRRVREEYEKSWD